MRLLILLTIFLLPFNALAKKDNSRETSFTNNPDLLSNNFGEYKGVTLSWEDEKIIETECSSLRIKDVDSYNQCQKFYKNLAFNFNIDSKICHNKAKRLANSYKNQSLFLIDEKGVVQKFTIQNGLFSETEEYEKCMDIMKWRDATNFRYGKIK